jgi:hypothetical protein
MLGGLDAGQKVASNLSAAFVIDRGQNIILRNSARHNKRWATSGQVLRWRGQHPASFLRDGLSQMGTAAGLGGRQQFFECRFVSQVLHHGSSPALLLVCMSRVTSWRQLTKTNTQVRKQFLGSGILWSPDENAHAVGQLLDKEVAFHESEYQRLRGELQAAHDASRLPE